MNVKETIVRTLPALGKYKRLAVAAASSLGATRRSYAQHGEDVRALELLAKFDMSGGLYVDVGANHPTDISNTYLLYRQGLKGIVIEPNPELARLFELFRPRDIALAVGCSDEAGIASFSVSKTPVLSSLSPSAAGDVWKVIRVALVPLDSVIAHVAPLWIPLLSVDVEGHSGAVLRGAAQTLSKTYLACVEATEGTREEAEVLAALEASNFSVIERTGCNLLALNNTAAQFQQFLRPRDSLSS